MKIPVLITAVLMLDAAGYAAQSQPHDGAVEITNELVKARFESTADGVKQQYFARRKGEWVPVVESFRPPQGKAVVVEVFADFENATYCHWEVVNTAFNAGPSSGATAPEQLLQGFQSKRLANSYAKSDQPVGKLLSPEFTIGRPYIGFLIGGGHHPGATCINLVVDGIPPHSPTPVPVLTVSGAAGTKANSWQRW
ncbi:MAG: hypothetical protein NTX54_05800 [Chloroflexi bacterium]|nr:hypothetical protein [Chloroflexota bacterium]